MTNKVILITGASAGLGQACADRLHASGWLVVGASRRGTSNRGWRALTMDVDDDDSVSQGVAGVIDEYDRIDALLACAGWGLAGAGEQTPISQAKAQVETNFWGVVRAVNAVLPNMRSQGKGQIVIMSSIGGILGIPFQAFYSASKFALEGYAESLAYEIQPFNIDITLVEPGNFKTDFTTSRRMVPTPFDDPYTRARTKAVDIMERDEIHGADPSDVARAVERVLNARRPPRRVSVGKLDERVGIIAKRLLPFGLFERAAKGSLGV